jgi:hypothetical protein
MPALDNPDTGVEPDAATRSPQGYPVDPEDPAARSPRVRLAAGVVAILLLVGVAFHLLFVTLFVAPPNQASRKYQSMTNQWIYPLFEQNWRLFAPDPLNVNIRVNARVQVRAADGTVTTSDWMDLTGDDVDHIRGNPFPSKADQNLLRRAWDFYTGSHNQDNTRANGRGELAEQYLRRIVVKRMQADGRGSGIVAVEVRAVSTPIPPPGQAKQEPQVRELGWWETRPDDFR